MEAHGARRVSGGGRSVAQCGAVWRSVAQCGERQCGAVWRSVAQWDKCVCVGSGEVKRGVGVRGAPGEEWNCGAKEGREEARACEYVGGQPITGSRALNGGKEGPCEHSFLKVAPRPTHTLPLALFVALFVDPGGTAPTPHHHRDRCQTRTCDSSLGPPLSPSSPTSPTRMDIGIARRG